MRHVSNYLSYAEFLQFFANHHYAKWREVVNLESQLPDQAAYELWLAEVQATEDYEERSTYLVPVYQGGKNLVHSQLLALPTTPIDFLAAPGAGKILVPTLILLHHQWVANYTNINAGAVLYVGFGSTGLLAGSLQETTVSEVSGLLAGGGPDAWAIIPGKQGVVESPAVVNVPLSIRIANDVDGDLTGGNTNNRLEIVVNHLVFDTVRGMFI